MKWNSGASRFGKSPSDWKSGLQKQSLPPQAIYKSAQADLVCVAAISNRQVFFPKWDAPWNSAFILPCVSSPLTPHFLAPNLLLPFLVKPATNGYSKTDWQHQLLNPKSKIHNW